MRQLRLRMSDETVRTVMVDENQPVANLMVIICTKLGITNHDEYSLIATGKHTINGRRKIDKNDGRIIDLKMEQLKKKLKTDEDLAWVDHSKTLDEQDIHEQDVVLLRRKFFYSDQNVDSRDPIQLGLLYVQTRDAILSGTHPVTVDGACKFAGLQCQAQLGDFSEGKTTRPGYYNLRDYLPADYQKSKHIERKIWLEHKKYLGLNELESKAKYVSEARSLPTYGVTFFLVKEKVAGKNKLVPRLLGITKDCVMRVDADTKAILKTWPLTTVKRWAASMNSFTLDFGDYSDSYYSVQTSEGEQISQLIAGYIDIILKRRKAKDHFGIEGDEGATMIEDSVAPSRATIIQNQPALREVPVSAAPSMTDLNNSIPGPTVQKQLLEKGPIVEPPDYRPAMEVKGMAEIGYESRPLTQYVTNYELSLPQRDLQDRLEQAQDAVEEAQKVLDKQQQQTGSHKSANYEQQVRELETKKSKLSNQFAEINAATAELVSLSAIPEEELNYPALNNAVEVVATSLPVVAKDVKIVASLMEDVESGERLINAARKLCKAFSDLLNAAEPGPTVPRQTLISAASRVGDATQALLYSINNGNELEGHELRQDDEDREIAEQLLGLAKSVASSAASLVLKAKDIAKLNDDEEIQDNIIGSATQCALATSQMVATAKIVAPTIYDAQCQRKLIGSCREVQRAVEGIQLACRDAVARDEQLSCMLNDSVQRVQQALDDLIDHVRGIKKRSSHHRTTQVTTTKTSTTKTTSSNDWTTHKIYDESSGRSISATDYEREDDPAKRELVNTARTLARATENLIKDIRPEPSHQQQQQQPQQTYVKHHSDYQTDHQRTNQYERKPMNVFDESVTDVQHLTNRQLLAASSSNLYDDDSQDRLTNQKMTTTITTTLYDDDDERSIFNRNNRLQQQQPDGQQVSRPLSMYDSESGNLTNKSYLQDQQHQQQVTTTETITTIKTANQEEHSSLNRSTSQQEMLNESFRQPEAAISGIVRDLDTTTMFSTSGSSINPRLDGTDEGGDSAYHRDNVLSCARALFEDTKSIIEATAALLRAALDSQRELIVDGRLDETETFYASDNNQWSEGLISAARMVAGATHSLVEAANSLVQGQSSEERLISAAKQVASSTNQLLVACKVKADPNSRTMQKLSNTGQQVKRATDNLVRAAQSAIENDEEQSLIVSNKKVSGIAQEISAREQILRKEKELQNAKIQLMAIRKAKYGNRPDNYQGYGGSLD